MVPAWNTWVWGYWREAAQVGWDLTVGDPRTGVRGLDFIFERTATGSRSAGYGSFH